MAVFFLRVLVGQVFFVVLGLVVLPLVQFAVHVDSPAVFVRYPRLVSVFVFVRGLVFGRVLLPLVLVLVLFLPLVLDLALVPAVAALGLVFYLPLALDDVLGSDLLFALALVLFLPLVFDFALVLALALTAVVDPRAVALDSFSFPFCLSCFLYLCLFRHSLFFQTDPDP